MAECIKVDERNGNKLEGLPEFISGVTDAVISFTKVENYTTFVAEYAFIDGDIIIHFFPPKEYYTQINGVYKILDECLLIWKRKFPQVLSPSAEKYFLVSLPVIMAQYIPEMTSWYFKASGFARRVDPDAFVLHFLSFLDKSLDSFYSS